MTSSGGPLSGPGGVSEPDWIDQILQRATDQIDGTLADDDLPAVPTPPPTTVSTPIAPAPTQQATPAQPVARPQQPSQPIAQSAAPLPPVQTVSAAPQQTQAQPQPQAQPPAQPVPPVQTVPASPPQPQPQAPQPQAQPAGAAASATDGLAEIRWVDSVEPEPVVTENLPFDAPVRAATPPAAAQPVSSEQDLIGARVSDVVPSHPVVPPAAEPDPIRVDPVQAPLVNPSLQPTELLPENVGRSAWDDQLAVDDGDPDGWDKLSWQDLDGDGDTPGAGVQQPSVTGQLIREWGPVLFAAIAIALFTRLVLVQAYHIPSGSMIPTLEDGDRVVVNRLSYRLGEIERGQVVVFAKPQGTAGENDLIKRVIGLPGETIQFVDNEVYVDGFRVDEPYLAQQDSTRPRLTIPGCGQLDPASDLCEIPEGHVFVMGDNRLGSSDSRVFGPIETESIVGRAFMRVWPLNNLGQL